MDIHIKWRTFYRTLPVRPARFQNWMTPLTPIAALFAFIPALSLILNILDATPVTASIVLIAFFLGLLLFAYDQKWATFHARQAGLNKNKWTHIKYKD